MRLVPMSDRVLVRRIDGESVSKGGIVIPDTAKEKPARGVVLAQGPDVKPPLVTCEIVFPKYAGTELKMDDGEVLIMRAEEILAVVDPNGTL